MIFVDYFRDIQLVLMRVPSGGWKAIYNLNEHWVKFWLLLQISWMLPLLL